MTERDRNELTNQPNSLNLEGKGNIMPDGAVPEQPQPIQEGSILSSQADEARAKSDQMHQDTLTAIMMQPYMDKFNSAHPTERAKIASVIDSMPSLPPEIRTFLQGQAVDGIAAQIEAARNRERNKIGVPEDLNDLAKLIMKASDPVWGVGGEKALIDTDTDTGKERINTEHFLDWMRTNMLKVHNFNPTSNVNFFSDLGMGVRNDTFGSLISFYEIVFQENLFLEKQVGENGEVKRVVNEDYKLLREQLLNEVFLFSLMRNGDIAYTMGRGDHKQMMDALTQAFAVNPLTRSNFFEFIMSMPSMHKKSLKDLEAGDGEKIKAKQEGNFFMGDGVRRALSAYMNIFDYKQLKNILGEDAALFKYKFDKYDEVTGKKIGEGVTSDDVSEHAKTRKDWFYEDGSVKLYAIETTGKNKGKYKKDSKGEYIEDSNGVPLQDFMDYINVFLSPNPEQVQQTEVREKMVLSIMQQCGISYNEAKLAEVWAYSMTHINGVAARNDTQSVAFDWWTRLTNFGDYRKRQKAEKRDGHYGTRYTMEGLKRIGLNFFEAARDIRGRTIQEIIQGGKGYDIDIEANSVKNNVDVEWKFARDMDGEIVLINKDGKAVKKGVWEVKIEDKKFKYLDAGGKEVNIKGLTAKKDHVIFRDAQGNIVDVGAKITSYKVVEEIDSVTQEKRVGVKYFDDRNQEFNVGDAKSKTVITTIDAPVQFKVDLQKQFMPNHMYTAAGVYEHIQKKVQMGFPDMIKGYDTHGNPILDQEKVDKVKGDIEHDVRYSLSTWPEINYADKFVAWERVEERDPSTGRLLAKKPGPNGEQQYLDEDWYIVGTKERDEPKTHLESKEQTILEQMFGVDALKFIQFEIEKRNLTWEDKIKGKTQEQIDSLKREGKGKHIETITGTSFDGTEKTVNVDLSQHDAEQFRIAIWRGAFDFLVASEITAHRDRGSGFEWYDTDKMTKAVDALRAGEFITPDQIGNIQKETRTKFRWLYLQDLSFIFATGGMEGFWKALQVMFKDVADDALKP